MRPVLRPALELGLAIVSASLLAAASEAAQEGALVDVSGATGIDFVNVSGDAPKDYILGSLGGGLALFDYDGDGDLDVYLVNGVELVGGERVARGPNRLYRNEGGFRFVDVTEAAGVGDTGWGVGCAVGDVDDDGAPDLYVTNIGANVLYRNRGDGTFEDVTESAGVGDASFGASAAFFDADGDGDLDLYVANYVTGDLARLPPRGSEPTCLWLGMAVMCGPRGLDGDRDVFYRNEGGRFVDASEASGLWDGERFYGLGVVAADYDDDGDQDLYVANDTQPNFLFNNEGTGRFVEVGLLSGVAYNASGDTEAGMGVDFGDVNGDEVLDLFVTNFSHETNTLYLGGVGGLFADATEESGLGSPSLGRLGWGARFADLDRDGDLDLFVADGHVYPRVGEVDTTTSYRQANQLFLNEGGGRFREASDLVGGEARASRGAAFGDLDGDGDVDVAVANIDDAPSLLRNELAPSAGWIGLRLVGRASPRDAYGARVWVRALGRTQVGDAHASGSILSSSDPRLVFGLGEAGSAEEIRIRWPSGATSRLENVPGGAYRLVVESRPAP
jgi:hypothetical protein